MIDRAPGSGRAFTLLELVVVLVITATVASFILPNFTNDTSLRLFGATSLLRSDIELAQVMTISRPEEPIVVRFDPDGSRYWLANAATPDTPILRSDNGESYLVVMGQGRAHAAAGVTLSVADMDDSTLEFNAQGGVADFSSEPSITLSIAGMEVELTIAATTGTITETQVEGTPMAEPEAKAEPLVK